MKKNPWEVLLHISPVSLASRPTDPNLIPILFEHEGSRYVGWQLRGTLPILFDCEYNNLWVPISSQKSSSNRATVNSSNVYRPNNHATFRKPAVSPNESTKKTESSNVTRLHVSEGKNERVSNYNATSSTDTKLGENNPKLFMFIWYVLTAVVFFLIGIFQIKNVFEIFLLLFISVIWPITLFVTVIEAIGGDESSIRTISIGIPTVVVTGVISAIIYFIRNQK